MPKYDVHPAPGGTGYLLDVQSDLLDGLNTRVVIPLLPESGAPQPARHLNPLIAIDDVRHVMATQFLSAVPAALLGAPVGNLAIRADEITRALDMVFQGV